jgi:hypothetical protein
VRQVEGMFLFDIDDLDYRGGGKWLPPQADGGTRGPDDCRPARAPRRYLPARTGVLL